MENGLLVRLLTEWCGWTKVLKSGKIDIRQKQNETKTNFYMNKQLTSHSFIHNAGMINLNLIHICHIQVSYRWDIFRWKFVCCVWNEEASFPHGSIPHYYALKQTFGLEGKIWGIFLIWKIFFTLIVCILASCSLPLNYWETLYFWKEEISGSKLGVGSLLGTTFGLNFYQENWN